MGLAARAWPPGTAAPPARVTASPPPLPSEAAIASSIPMALVSPGLRGSFGRRWRHDGADPRNQLQSRQLQDSVRVGRLEGVLRGPALEVLPSSAEWPPSPTPRFAGGTLGSEAGRILRREVGFDRHVLRKDKGRRDQREEAVLVAFQFSIGDAIGGH